MRTREPWSFRLVDSLEKVFPDFEPPSLDQLSRHNICVGETLSFQVAFRLRLGLEHSGLVRCLRFSVGGIARRYVTLRSVELVPCARPVPLAGTTAPMAHLGIAPAEHDGGYLRDTAGLFPDVLRAMPDGAIAAVAGEWRSVWIDLVVDDIAEAGEYQLSVRAMSLESGDLLFEEMIVVTVLPVRLPPLGLVHTEWFHWDGLAAYYGVDVFSEEHWRIVEKFVRKASELDINCMLTPVWTPPLDTAVGGRRTPVQLVDISLKDGNYNFEIGRAHV